MLDRIKPIVPPSLANPADMLSAGAQPAAMSGSNVFRTILTDSIQQVQNYQTASATAAERFLSGENEELHQVALAGQKAELSFEMFLQVRNKLVQAYQEVMRMQV